MIKWYGDECEVETKAHCYMARWWANWKSWGVQVNFNDGFQIQVLCFYLEIWKEY